MIGDPQEPPEAPESPDYCQQCGSELHWLECPDCGGTGDTRPGEMYELDPVWYSKEDTEMCEMCDGNGGWILCSSCRDAARRKEAGAAGQSPT